MNQLPETLSIKLARRTQTPKSAIRKVFDQIPGLNEERQRTGLAPIISLAIGEPHLAANPLVLQALSAFLQKPEAAQAFRYSPAQGRPDTLQAITQLYQIYYPQVRYTRQEVMVTNGASQGLMNAFSIFLEAGDAVLVFEPYFSTYRSQINTLGGELVAIDTRDCDFKPTANTLRAALTRQTNAKMLILNYPNNPSGVSLNRAEVLALAEVLRDFPNIVIIADDVYRELSFAEHITLLDVAPDLQARCIVINSGAKGLIGGPDLRVGMVGARAEWINAMSTQQLNTVSGVSYLTQVALIAAVETRLSQPQAFQQWLQPARETYRAQVTWMQQQFQALGFKVINSGGGFFLLVDASRLLGKIITDEPLQQKIGTQQLSTDEDIVLYLLHRAGVAVVPGSGFGIDPTAGYFRVSCAKNLSDLQQAIVNIQNALSAGLADAPAKSHLVKEIKQAGVNSIFANSQSDARQMTPPLPTAVNPPVIAHLAAMGQSQ